MSNFTREQFFALGLDTRTANALCNHLDWAAKRGGLPTPVTDLSVIRRIPDSAFLCIPNFGRKSLNRLREVFPRVRDYPKGSDAELDAMVQRALATDVQTLASRAERYLRSVKTPEAHQRVTAVCVLLNSARAWVKE